MAGKKKRSSLGPKPTKEEDRLLFLLYGLSLSRRHDEELTKDCDIAWWFISPGAFSERVQQGLIDKEFAKTDSSGTTLALTPKGFSYGGLHFSKVYGDTD